MIRLAPCIRPLFCAMDPSGKPPYVWLESMTTHIICSFTSQTYVRDIRKMLHRSLHILSICNKTTYAAYQNGSIRALLFITDEEITHGYAIQYSP
jgi:hypothetical protein